MDSNPTPWRVFDAPAAAPDAAVNAAPVAASSTPSTSPTWRWPLQPNVVLALAGAGVLALAAVVLAIGGIGAGTSIGAGDGPSGGPFASGGSGGTEVVVEVAGAVARPGVYHVPAGSRIGDAIASAGGFGPRVAADRVEAELNLAAIVHDGDRILVPSRDSAKSGASPGIGGAPTTGPAGPALIDLNHATREQLDTLPGVGLVTADKIIASRAETPFRTVDELRERGLVGQKTFDKLRPLITVS